MTNFSGLRRDLEFFLLSCRSEGLSQWTLKDYRQKLEMLVQFLDVQGIQASSEVTSTHIRFYMLDLEARMKMVSVGDYVRVARRFFSWLTNEGTITASPAQTIKPPKHPLKVVQPCSASDIQKMLAVCEYDAEQPFEEAWLGVRNTALLLVLLDTGIRRRELTDLRLSSLSESMDRLTVLGKNRRERIVAIHPETQKALLKYLIIRTKLADKLYFDHDAIWIGRRGLPLQPGGVTQLIEAIGKRANVNVERCSPHTLRHTVGTMSLRNGASERDVQDMLGHLTSHMTRRYTATIGSEQAAARHKTFSAVGALFKK